MAEGTAAPPRGSASLENEAIACVDVFHAFLREPSVHLRYHGAEELGGRPVRRPWWACRCNVEHLVQTGINIAQSVTDGLWQSSWSWWPLVAY